MSNIRGINVSSKEAFKELSNILDVVKTKGHITKREAFKMNSYAMIAADFGERKLTGEVGEELVSDFYGVDPMGGNTPDIDLIDKNAKKHSVKTRTIEGDVDGIKVSAMEKSDFITLVVYEENEMSYQIWEATPVQFKSNHHRQRGKDKKYSTTCKNFIKYAKKRYEGKI